MRRDRTDGEREEHKNRAMNEMWRYLMTTDYFSVTIEVSIDGYNIRHCTDTGETVFDEAGTFSLRWVGEDDEAAQNE